MKYKTNSINGSIRLHTSDEEEESISEWVDDFQRNEKKKWVAESLGVQSDPTTMNNV
jgi:hypothetical protein